jgi:hypothetical protein
MTPAIPYSGGVGLTGLGPQPPLAPYAVTFYERDRPQNRITARLGETPPTPGTGGGGGGTGGGTMVGDWSVISLPKRSSVLAWRGRMNLILLSVPVILGHPGGGPVTPARSVLNAMWRPSNPTVEPPVVKVRSDGDAVPYQALDFVITALTWGDAVGDLSGNRVMQRLTVDLLEYREDEVLQQAKAAKPKHRGRSYTIHNGDTLTSIAKKLKVKGGWRTIGDAQHPQIHDPRKIRVGQRLLIP